MTGRTPIEQQRWNEAAHWLARADQDIRVAEMLLAGDVDLIWSAAFHCQQAAEKMAKGALLAAGAEYPKIHDVAELGRRLTLQGSKIGEALENLGGLTDWYIISRYPASDPDFTPSLSEVHAALSRLKSLREQLGAVASKSG